MGCHGPITCSTASPSTRALGGREEPDHPTHRPTLANTRLQVEIEQRHEPLDHDRGRRRHRVLGRLRAAHQGASPRAGRSPTPTWLTTRYAEVARDQRVRSLSQRALRTPVDPVDRLVSCCDSIHECRLASIRSRARSSNRPVLRGAIYSSCSRLSETIETIFCSMTPRGDPLRSSDLSTSRCAVSRRWRLPEAQVGASKQTHSPRRCWRRWANTPSPCPKSDKAGAQPARFSRTRWRRARGVASADDTRGRRTRKAPSSTSRL